MDRATELRLLDECLELARRGEPFVAASERLVPVEEYTDPARFERERDVLFRRTTHLVAHASELPRPGSFLTDDRFGVPLLLVRGEDGVARAFLNVCRHRGARVVLAESGEARRFACPYHAWTYDSTGALVAVRHPVGFPTLAVGATRLVQVPCTEAGGFLWARPSPATSGEADREPTIDADLAGLLGELDALGSGTSHAFARERREWRANWKLLVDGGLESYHFRIAHRTTVGPFFCDNLSTFEVFGDHLRSVLPRASILELEDTPRDTWDIRRATHLIYSFFPGATILVQAGHLELVSIVPLAVDRSLVEIATLVPAPGAGGHPEPAHEHWAKNHAFTKRTLHEDFELAEQIQAGIASGANHTFRFASFEGAIGCWHDRITARLSTLSAAP